MKETNTTIKEETKNEKIIEGIETDTNSQDNENAEPIEVSVVESTNVEGLQAESENSDEEEQEPEPQLTPLEQAQKESAEFKDAWQRERADFSNYRKRMMQEKSQIRTSAAGMVIHDLLEGLDNMDRVLNAKSENEELTTFIESVKMIKGQFIDVLKKHNVDIFSPQDQEFDPSRMEAISIEEVEGLTKDMVIEVFQDGYMQSLDSNPHTLRPARVKVGKPVKKQEETKETE